MIFLFEEKMFCSQDVEIFVLLVNPQTSKSVMSSEILLLIKTYTSFCFFVILNSIKTKFGQMTNNI